MGLHVVVLAGGSGTRLWPLSRGGTPKHLLPLAPGGRSLLRATVDRVLPLGVPVWVVTVAGQADLCAAELLAAGADPRRVIAEPAARGTGPALGLAMAWLARDDPDAVVCSVHADHDIHGDDGYRRSLLAAAGWADAGRGLATIAVAPTHAATGLGYVEVGDALDAAAWRPCAGTGDGAAAAMLADRSLVPPAAVALGFTEKPRREVAERFLRGGRHLWNTGLFAWRLRTFVDELRAASREIADRVDAVAAARGSGDEAAAARLYAALPTVAVDPLVMERTRRLVAVRAAFGWSDLGSWADLAEARRVAGEGDDSGNVVTGDAVVVGASGCLVEARGGRTVAVVGAEGLVVVDTPEALLVVPAADAQRVRDVVDRLRADGRTDLL